MQVSPKQLTHWRQSLKAQFSLEEIKNLCADLDIDFEDLGGEGKEGKARELIAYCQRRKWLDRLLAKCEELRPRFPWHDPDASVPNPPPTPATFNLEESIVAILTLDGKVAGTGFVVAGPLIVTCAHVVYKLTEPVTLRPHTHPGSFLADLITLSSPKPKAAGEKDVAVLRPRADFPGLPVLTLGPGLALKNAPFRTFGYARAGAIQGLHGEGVVRGRVQDETGLPFLQLDSKEVAHGMSGAPVVNTASQQVVGMISSGSHYHESAKLRDLVLAVPGELIQEFLPGSPTVLTTAPERRIISAKDDTPVIQLKPHKQKRNSKDKWVSIIVVNSSEIQSLTECTGYLESIFRIGDDGTKTDLGIYSIQLGWSQGTEMGDKSIPAGKDWSLDVARTNLAISHSQFFLTTQDNGDAYPQSIGMYKIRIHVTGNLGGESIKPLVFEGFLEYKGNTNLTIHV